jgi:hypothetical protein
MNPMDADRAVQPSGVGLLGNGKVNRLRRLTAVVLALGRTDGECVSDRPDVARGR